MRLRLILSATTPRSPRSGIRTSPASAAGAEAAAALGSAAAGAPAAPIARSTSARRISPSGPDPVSVRSSTPFCRASRRTSGEMTGTGPGAGSAASARTGTSGVTAWRP